MAVCRRTYKTYPSNGRRGRVNVNGVTVSRTLACVCVYIHMNVFLVGAAMFAMTDPANFFFFWCGFFSFFFATRTFPANVWKATECLESSPWKRNWPKTGVQRLSVGQLTCSQITDWPFASPTSKPQRKFVLLFFFFFVFSGGEVCISNYSTQKKFSIHFLKRILRSTSYLNLKEIPWCVWHHTYGRVYFPPLFVVVVITLIWLKPDR